MAMQHTLLLVDDEESIINALRRLFLREGYQVLAATSGTDGLSVLEQNEVSLIISDYRMPHMTGPEFLARSIEVAPHCKRIMLTGFSDADSVTESINRGGISRYITKPWNDQDIKQSVRDALKQYELEFENRKLTAELIRKNQELEHFNARLEEAVTQRTRELQLKVKELAGKDRITQHMLSVHSLDETLKIVLQVVSEIIEMEEAVVYLMKEGTPKAVAAIDYAGRILQPSDVLKIQPTSLHAEAFARVAETRQPVNMEHTEESDVPPFAIAPIVRGENVLGLIEVASPRSRETISADELSVVASFALQAAMAINDAQIHSNMDSWKGEIAAVLKDWDL